MISTQSGSLRLFRCAGIQVYLHWSWFVIALIELTTRAGVYESPWWNVAEYLGLFVIVLLHEFGHSLACRQTGGVAEEIILWPFGGIAFVNAPQRPGAQLWSIAAGPLVNVVLAPVLLGATWLSFSLGLDQTLPDLVRLLEMLLLINLYLMAFNLLPIYPLDGGQILRSLLWFMIGRARSLWVAAVVGLFGLVAFVGYAIWRQSIWLGLMALWSIAAGPLVNVVLAPVLLGATWLSFSLGLDQTLPDLVRLLEMLLLINLYLMAFNLLPIYPLDGGQILRSLLWFMIGRARSLWVAAVVGLFGLVAFVGYAIWRQSIWLGLMALFLGQQAWNGLQQARALRALERLPRHRGFACPSCQQAPPGGPMWLCRACGNRFDPFSTRAVCPHCQTPQATTTCAHCGEAHPIERWSSVPRWNERGGPGPVIDV